MTAAQTATPATPKKPAKGSGADAQRQRVLARLRASPATTIELRRNQDVMMPAARIIELRRQGYLINTQWVEAYTEAGERHRVGRYELVEEPLL